MSYKSIELFLINIFILLIMSGIGLSKKSYAGESFTINLWPQDIINDTTVEKEIPSRGDNVIRITNIFNPSITVYKSQKENSPAVVICPGGGYSILAINIEGTEVAEWLNSLGVNAVVLKYTVPKNREAAFKDVQRAMRLVRYHAGDWNFDSNHIGIIGFSAGGHLAARVSTGFEEPAYASVDDADETICRPDFTILVYPAYLSRENYKLSDDITVSKEAPPAFIVQTQDDKNFVGGSIAYYLALKELKIPSELHLFQKGGHGYGLRSSEHAVSNWPVLCEAWLKSNNIIK